MAFRSRFDWLLGRQQPQRPEVPSSNRRTVNVPGRAAPTSGGRQSREVSDFNTATNAPWRRTGHHEDFSVQRVRESEWGLPRGQDPESGTPDVTVRSSTSNPSRPRTTNLGYSYEDSELTITFRDGAVYRYEDVSPSEFSELQHAWSTGKQMNAMSIDSHEYMRIG